MSVAALFGMNLSPGVFPELALLLGVSVVFGVLVNLRGVVLAKCCCLEGVTSEPEGFVKKLMLFNAC